MSPELLSDSRLWPFLLRVDQDLALRAQEGNCVECGARLHSARYPRKPRGCPEELPPEYAFRFSFCCEADDCRRRLTPPSVRFLGPTVHLMVMVVLLTAMRQGPTPRAARELERRFQVSRRTIARWQMWWREVFPATPFWKHARAQLSGPPKEADLPLGLLLRFEVQSSLERFVELLKLLSPITARLKVG